jgi:hypothetical protein
VLLLIPVSIRPALAAYDLAHAYGYQLMDVPKSTDYLSHGFALGTYGDLEYGYEAYEMYAYNQQSVLTGENRTRAYQAAVSVLSANFNTYTYDARTALDLALVLSLTPEGVSVDKNVFANALGRAMLLSPKRPEPTYILANLAIADANRFPPSSASRLSGYATARKYLTDYIANVPAVSMPHFLLAQLDYASGDAASAAEEAAKGKADYMSDLATARTATVYYETVKDWTDCKFFLNEIVGLAPSDTASLYDLAKVTYLSGDPAGADAIVTALRTSHPEILPTDQNFLAAITAYEQSKK